MEKRGNKKTRYYTIDLLHIFESIRKRLAFVLLAGVISAFIGFFISNYYLEPIYESEIMINIKNLSSHGDDKKFSVGISEIIAAKNLVNTYGQILKSRQTLEQVIEDSGVCYSWKQLSRMVDFELSNETEIMNVAVWGSNREEVAKISKSISKVLIERIKKIVDGADVAVIDSGEIEPQRSSSPIMLYTVGAFVLIVFILIIFIVVFSLYDNRVYDDEYIMLVYDYPILGKVPNLSDDKK